MPPRIYDPRNPAPIIAYVDVGTHLIALRRHGTLGEAGRDYVRSLQQNTATPQAPTVRTPEAAKQEG